VNLSDLVFASSWAPDEVIVFAGDDELTRADLEARATAVAEALVELGVEEGTPVGVMLPNGASVLAALFGVWRAGAVYVPLNPRLTGVEVANIREAVDPGAIITIDAHRARFDDLPVVLVDELCGDGELRVRPGAVGAKRLADDIALVQFTSGTTGKPKPVLLRHDGVLELIDGVVAKLRGSSGAASSKPAMPNLIPVSLSLWAGIYNVLFAFSIGAPVIVMDGFDPKTFAALVTRFGIRSTVLPPAAMAMLADDESITTLEPLRFVRSITAPLSPLQARRFKDRFGIAVLNSYGQTEIGGEIVGWNAADAREHGEDKLGSVGRPHRGVEVRTVDDGGNDVEPGGSGELWFRTPALSAGYADGSDLGDRLSPDGFFRTGDVGRVDADGFVWIEGRASDMVNRGGLKVHPGEVEEVLRLAPAVADAAVVGVPDERLGEVPWAFLVLVDGAVAPEGGDLESLCRAHLAPYKVPVGFTVVDELPRNEVGKVLKRELIDRPG
jgi:acyl-CoA synthetase (AMP-forming)/AMP-acid ligase II